MSEPDYTDMDTREEGRKVMVPELLSYGTLPSLDLSESESDTSEEDLVPVGLFFSSRLLVTLVCQFGIICNFASQSIMGASLLTMVRHNTSDVIKDHSEGVNLSDSRNASCGECRGLYNQTMDGDWYYGWDTRTQGWILSAFFIGYYVVQIPAGLLIQRFGAKRVTVGGALCLSMLQGVAVAAPRFGTPYFIVTMVLAGVANGCLYVPIMDILAKWVPPHESSSLVTLAVSGMGIGIAMVYGLSASTSHLQLWGGWPFNFIVLGLLLLVFAGLLLGLVSDTPAESGRISDSELLYIRRCFLRGQSDAWQSSAKGLDIPWKKILTSGPVYAIAASQFGTDWMQYFFITLFPLYLKHVRGMDTDKADMLAGLPWLGFPVFGYMVSTIVDYIRRKEIVSTTLLRKTVDGWAKVVPMGLLVAMVYLPEGSETLLTFLYLLTILLISLEGSTWLANVVDVSHQYAGVVSSVAQTLSLPGTFVLPLLVAAITPHNTEEEWQTCVIVMMGIVSFSYIIYVVYGSSEPQGWESTSNNSSSNNIGDDVSSSSSCNRSSNALLQP